MLVDGVDLPVLLKLFRAADLDGGACQVEQTLIHCLQLCPGIQELHNSLINTLSRFLDREVNSKQLITLSFNQRSKKKLKCALCT